MIEYLDGIYRWFSKNRRPVAKLLQEGVTSEYFEKVTGSLELRLPIELKELYMWRNGTANQKGFTLGDIAFMPGFFFLPIEEAVDNYNSFKKDKEWNESWFPFMANGGGDFFVVNCKDDNMARGASVIGFMLNEEGHEVEYLSVTSMINTIYECYERGIYFLDKDGYIEVDLVKEAIVANVINPGLERWESEIQ